MKLSSILAAASLLAVPGLAAAQVHGVGGPARGTAGGAAHVGFHGGVSGRRPGLHHGFHGRFRRRDDVVALYPYWGWSDCAFDVDCDQGGADPAGMTRADYADPPPPPPGYGDARPAPRRAAVNECSDWVWNARLRRSLCKRPFRG